METKDPVKLQFQIQKLKEANTELWRENQKLKNAVTKNCQECSKSECVVGSFCFLFRWSPYYGTKRDSYGLTGAEKGQNETK